MDISQRGIDFIVSFEGKKTLQKDGRYKSYLDTLAKPNVWTVYCGLTKGVGRDTVWSVEQCENAFRKELAIYEDAVEQHVKVPLNQNQFDALVSFTYNCGVGALKGSTMVKLLNQGKYSEVPNQLARWNKAGGKVWNGLVRRRAAEGALFIEPMPKAEIIAAKVEEGDEIPADAMPQRVEENKGSGKEAVRSPTVWGGLIGLFSSVGAAWQQAGVVASDTTAEVVAKKQSLTGFEALWSHFGISLGSVLLIITVASLGIVLTRHITRYVEGRA